MLKAASVEVRTVRTVRLLYYKLEKILSLYFTMDCLLYADFHFRVPVHCTVDPAYSRTS